MTIEDLTGNITTIFNACTTWVGTVINTIEEYPLLLLSVLIPFVSIGISLLKKLIHVKN